MLRQMTILIQDDYLFNLNFLVQQFYGERFTESERDVRESYPRIEAINPMTNKN